MPRLIRRIFSPDKDERYEIPDDDEIDVKVKKKKKEKESWPTYGSERKKRQKNKEPSGSAWGVYE